MKFTKAGSKKKLVTALMSAYRDEKALDMLTQLELDIPLNTIAQAARTYQESVFNLVNWAESHNKVVELVIAASRENPGNSELQQFVFDNLKDLLGDAFNPIDDQFLDQFLKNFVNALNKLQDVKVLFDALFAIEYVNKHDIETHRGDEMKVILQQSMPLNAICTYDFFDILKSYSRDDANRPIILDLAKTLIEHHALDSFPQVRDDLASEIKRVIDHYKFEVSEAKSSVRKIDDEYSNITDIALMLVISEKETQSEKDSYDCTLKAYLQAYNTSGGRSQYIKSYIFDEVYSQAGKNCKFSKINEELKELINQSIRFIVDYSRDYLAKIPLLIIEVFLPVKWMLTEKVDLWEINILDNKIGSHYPIIVRSYERNLEPLLRYSLLMHWDETCKPFFENKPRPDDIESCISHITSENELFDGMKLRKKVAVKMTCPPPIEAYDRFITSLIKAKVPIVVWTRCSSLDKVEDQDWGGVLDRFFEWEIFSKWSDWLREFQQCREEAMLTDAPHESLGYHLSILADHPDRIPETLPLDQWSN
ncbi:MAG: effector-associated domain EAD1-containing protein [Snowella sp.]|nr:effector-associated domain EAD1-containing protein [Snowella sp.]